jgi:hypothetical protein
MLAGCGERWFDPKRDSFLSITSWVRIAVEFFPSAFFPQEFRRVGAVMR